MKLKNKHIEQILNDAPKPFIGDAGYPYIDGDGEYWFSKNVRHNLDDLREILSLRKELEQTKKELEQVINEESDGVNGVV